MKQTLWICLCLSLLTPLACDEIMYPTVADVNTLAEADHEFVSGLHEAGNQLMTEQHSAMTPELAEAFAVMQQQYNELSLQLKTQAGKVQAEGPSIGGLSGFGGGVVPSLLSMFGLGSLIPIWNMFFGKSRASQDITDLKHSLAVKAGSDQEIPG